MTKIAKWISSAAGAAVLGWVLEAATPLDVVSWTWTGLKASTSWLAVAIPVPRWAVAVVALAPLAIADLIRFWHRRRWRLYRQDQIGELLWSWRWAEGSTKDRAVVTCLLAHCPQCRLELDLHDSIVDQAGRPKEALAACTGCSKLYRLDRLSDDTRRSVAREVARRVRTSEYRRRRRRERFSLNTPRKETTGDQIRLL